MPSKCCAHGGLGACRAESLPLRESWCWNSLRHERQFALSNPNKQAGLAAGVSDYLPNHPPGHARGLLRAAVFTRSSGNHPHKDALCLCAWRRAASRGHGTRAGQRECPGAKSPGPACPAHLSRKGHPTVPWLKYGCPVRCTQRAPPPKSTARSRRTRKGRTGRSAEVCFVARRRGQAPQCPTPGPPHLPGCRTRGVLHDPLTSSPVHHLFGAPLGHGLHGKRLHCPLG